MIKQFYFKKFYLAYIICFAQFKCQIVLFDPLIRPYQVLPFRGRVDLGVMAMKGYTIFPKAPASDYLTSYLGHSLGESYLTA